jgi:3-isopropylmalate/(R)-2-methylmalate dehydratase small subunit
MKAFTSCEGYAAPILRDNVDTDLIIRIERISKLKRGAFAPWAFEALRYHADGSEDASFVLNRPPFRDAKILLSGVNFGCGSSREMAVWALEDFGIRCVIAPSYGDIFYGNCLQNGLLPITLSAQRIAALAAVAETGAMLRVDLREGLIVADGIEPVGFDFPAAQKEALLLGLDEVDQSLQLSAQIDSFQKADRVVRPWVYQTG